MKDKRIRRYVLAFSLAAILLTPACSSTPIPTATPGDTFVPVTAAPAAPAEKAKIAVSTFWPIEWKSVEKRINDTLATAGQNVAFEIQKAEYQEGKNSDDVFLQNVKLDIAANPSAAAYLFDTDRSGTLFDKGLTMDPTELIKQYAPVYYLKYKELFRERLTGIPVGIYDKPLWSKKALLLKQDFASAGSFVSTVEGLFNFIDEIIVQPKKGYEVLAYEGELIGEWALEKGCYPLDNFGVDGFLCCGIGDKNCTPVPVEEIPGFADFITEMKELQQSGALLRPYESAGDRECIGVVDDLYSFFAAEPITIIPFAKGEYTAQLFSPELPGYIMSPNYTCELAIPAQCDKAKAAEIVRFVEWMYANQDNYDSIVYGEKDVDFRIEAERCIPLVDGRQLEAADLDGKPFQGVRLGNILDLFYSWPGAMKLFNSDYYRMPSNAPQNVDVLIAGGLRQNRRFPLADHIVIKSGTYGKLLETSEDMKALCEQRTDIINRILSDPAVFTKESLSHDLEALKKLNNRWLCEQYAALLNRSKVD